MINIIGYPLALAVPPWMLAIVRGKVSLDAWNKRAGPVAFSVACVYLLLAVFTSLVVVQQDGLDGVRAQVKAYVDPDLVPLPRRKPPVCSPFSLSLVLSNVDIFVISHSFGWLFRMLSVRNVIVATIAQIIWELVEYMLQHHLHNFRECWWDQILLDIVICNSLGIFVAKLLLDWGGNDRWHWRGLLPAKNNGVKITNNDDSSTSSYGSSGSSSSSSSSSMRRRRTNGSSDGGSTVCRTTTRQQPRKQKQLPQQPQSTAIAPLQLPLPLDSTSIWARLDPLWWKRTLSPPRDTRASEWRQILAVWVAIAVMLMVDINTFYIKHLLDMPTRHSFIAMRIFLYIHLLTPAMTQLYGWCTLGNPLRPPGELPYFGVTCLTLFLEFAVILHMSVGQFSEEMSDAQITMGTVCAAVMFVSTILTVWSIMSKPVQSADCLLQLEKKKIANSSKKVSVWGKTHLDSTGSKQKHK